LGRSAGGNRVQAPRRRPDRRLLLAAVAADTAAMTSPVRIDDDAARPTWRVAAYAALALGAAWGAWQIAFLCDDAYIHFRFASNLHEGRGIVWNDAPFAPVEGAGFLWVVVLAAIWGLTGSAPPDAANPFSLGCGLVQFALLAFAADRLRDRDGRRLPAIVGLAALLAVVGNRTVLQWWTGGLDTPLANVFGVWWALHAFRAPGPRPVRWLALWALAAALGALARPDGLPAAAATAAVGGLLWLRGGIALRGALAGLSPLLLVVALTVWRKLYYGDWLPNTYYAKVVSSWPDAGWRYLGCFALENGAWLWPLLALPWLLSQARAGVAAVGRALLANAPAAAAVAVVLFNAGYYCFKVGGDHFEYRVLSQTAALGTLAVVAMAARLARGPALPLAAALALVVGCGAGWFHLACTSAASAEGIAAVTPHAPAALRPVARWFDRQQVWLFFRYIGLRCNHHAARLRSLEPRFPARVRHPDAATTFPIRAESAVGLPGWMLPDVALIDVFGLNDWVVARTPVRPQADVDPAVVAKAVRASDRDGDGWLAKEELRDALGAAFGARPDDGYGMFVLRLFWSIYRDDGSERVTLAEAEEIGGTISFARRMAHERLPPPGYVEAFEPNVDVAADGAVTVRPRATPMTAARLRAIEAEWRAKVASGSLPR
jgi:arabinofuranosyltransferase